MSGTSPSTDLGQKLQKTPLKAHSVALKIWNSCMVIVLLLLWAFVLDVVRLLLILILLDMVVAVAKRWLIVLFCLSNWWWWHLCENIIGVGVCPFNDPKERDIKMSSLQQDQTESRQKRLIEQFPLVWMCASDSRNQSAWLVVVFQKRDESWESISASHQCLPSTNGHPMAHHYIVQQRHQIEWPCRR